MRGSVEEVLTITDRVDAITRIPEEYRRPDPPAPKSVKIELTNRCNYRCQYCARAQSAERQARGNGDMDWRLFQRITREMRDAGVEEIGVFYLG